MLKFPSTLESLNLGNSFNQSLEGVNLPSNLQTLTFGIMFMTLYDYLSQEQTSGFIYNKVPYFAPSEMEEFTYIYTRKKTSSGVNLACISQIIKKVVFFFRQVRFIYTFSSTLPPKLRMLHSKLFSVTPILTRVWKLRAPSKF